MFNIIDDRQLDLSLFLEETEEEAIANGKKLVAQTFSPIIRQFYHGKFTITDLGSKNNKVIGIFKGKNQHYKFEINSSGNFSYLETQQPRLDAKKCKVGKSCQNTCISRGKRCSGKIKNFAKHRFGLLQDTAKSAGNGEWVAAGIAVTAGLFLANQSVNNFSDNKFANTIAIKDKKKD